MTGKPVIKGTRIPLYVILQMIKDGTTFEMIIDGSPKLVVDDIKAAIEFAIKMVNDESDSFELISSVE